MRPLQRAGNRRYYRPADVALARRIHNLLSNEGYTVRGVQKLLRERPKVAAESPAVEPAQGHEPAMFAQPIEMADNGGVDVDKLIELRDRLRDALTD